MSGEAMDRAVERLALLIFSGAPQPGLTAEQIDRFVAQYKASAEAGDGNMPASWALAMERARWTIGALGLVPAERAEAAEARAVTAEKRLGELPKPEWMFDALDKIARLLGIEWDRPAVVSAAVETRLAEIEQECTAKLRDERDALQDAIAAALKRLAEVEGERDEIASLLYSAGFDAEDGDGVAVPLSERVRRLVESRDGCEETAINALVDLDSARFLRAGWRRLVRGALFERDAYRHESDAHRTALAETKATLDRTNAKLDEVMSERAAINEAVIEWVDNDGLVGAARSLREDCMRTRAECEAAQERVAEVTAERDALRWSPPPREPGRGKPATDRAIDRLAAVLWAICAEGFGSMRRTVAAAENIGKSALSYEGEATQRGMRDRTRTMLRELGLVPVDGALVDAVRRGREAVDAAYEKAPRTIGHRAIERDEAFEQLAVAVVEAHAAIGAATRASGVDPAVPGSERTAVVVMDAARRVVQVATAGTPMADVEAAVDALREALDALPTSEDDDSIAVTIDRRLVDRLVSAREDLEDAAAGARRGKGDDVEAARQVCRDIESEIADAVLEAREATRG